MKAFFALALVAFVALSEARTLVRRDAKSDLIDKANALIKKTDEALTHLRGNNHQHEVALVKHHEDQIKKLITDLQAATDDSKVTALQHQLERADVRLEHELSLIQHRVPSLPHHPRTTAATPTLAKRDLKSDLTTKGNDLLTKADAAIKTLTEAKRTHEAANLKHEETELKKLISDLAAATDDAKVKTIEHNLQRLETRIQHQIDNAAHPHTAHPHVTTAASVVLSKRATKDELITKGNDLVKKADEAVTKLTADKKTHEASVLKHEEEHLKKLISDLQAATDDAKVRALEHQLAIAEGRLDHELTRHNVHPHPHVTTQASA